MRTRIVTGWSGALAPPLALALVLVAACGPDRADRPAEAPRDEPSASLLDTLLALQTEERRVHIEYDARAFAALMTDSTVQVNRGLVSHASTEALLERFGAYFAGTSFAEWADIVPPSVRVDAEGGRADVLVERRVRGVSIDAGGRAVGHHTRFAWTEMWVRTPSGWRITQVTSTDRPGERSEVAHEAAASTQATGSEEARTARVDAILSRARSALSVRWDLPHLGLPLGADPLEGAAAPADVDGVRSLSFVAACNGPDGAFRTALWSGDGQAAGRGPPGHRMLQIGSGETQVVDLDRTAGATQDALYAFVAGHSQLLTALDARRVLGPPTLMERGRFAGEEAEILSFALGAGRVDVFYSLARGIPLGTRLDIGPGQPPVTTYWTDWEPLPREELARADIAVPLLLPRRLVFLQGDEAFVYRIERIELNREATELSLD